MKQIERVERSVLTQQGWAVASTPAAAAMMTLQIGLALQNTDQLYTTLLDVSNPKSKSYGKWMDRDEANAIVQPSKAADDAVVNWLKSEGVEKVISDGTWVTFATTTETANRLLNANFQQFERHGILKIRTTEYSVPQSLVEHIDLIHPTTFFGKTQAFRPSHLPEGLRKRDITDLVYKEPEKTEKKTARTHTTAANGKFAQLVPPPTNSTVAAGCKTVVTPECLKQFYNVGNYTATASSGSRIGFGSFLNQSAQYADLKMYLETFLIPDQNFTKVFVNNASNSQDPARASDVAGEANLDVQNMIGIAHPLPVFEYLTGGSPPIVNDLEQTNTTANTNEPYLPFYQYLLSKRNSQLPQVISNSYGEPEQTVPRRYAERVCTSIALMGLRGVTVLESSGDTGVGSYCKSNDGTNRDRFLPQFPATCPWITAIGGTESALPEIAWKDSSGGFSDYFSRPDYQNDHVETVRLSLENLSVVCQLMLYPKVSNRMATGSNG
jgi:tripeptidyl-peptidase-1